MKVPSSHLYKMKPHLEDDKITKDPARHRKAFHKTRGNCITCFLLSSVRNKLWKEIQLTLKMSSCCFLFKA